MAPLVAVPNVQMAPTVETSLFTGQISDPAVGRLPFATVPAAISAQRAENNRQQTQERSSSTPDPAVETSRTDALQRLLSGGPDRIETAFSTPFMAQLLGQLALGANVVNGIFGGGTGTPSGFVDFDRLAEFGDTKYKPSEAAKPRGSQPQTEALEHYASKAKEAVVEPTEQKVEPVTPAEVGVTTASAAPPVSLSASSAGAGFGGGQGLSVPDVPKQKVSVATASSQPPAATKPKSSAQEEDVSLIHASGADAYRTTQSSNRTNLGAPKIEISLVL